MHDGNIPLGEQATNRYDIPGAKRSVVSRDSHSVAQPTLSSDREKMLVFLDDRASSFPFLDSFVKSKYITPGVFFLPQTLKVIDNELSYNQELVPQTLDYIDMVKVYSSIVYGDAEHFTNELIKIAASNRVIGNPTLMLATDALDDYTFTSQQAAVEFLQNNPMVLSIYVYTLVQLALQTPQE